MERPNKGCLGPDNWSQFCEEPLPLWGRYQMQNIHLRGNKAKVPELVEGQQGWLGQQEKSKGHNVLPNISHPFGIVPNELNGADEV